MLWFLLATLISRSIRYFGLAFIVWKFGDKAEAFIKKHKWTSVILAIALIATFWLGSRLLASP